MSHPAPPITDLSDAETAALFDAFLMLAAWRDESVRAARARRKLGALSETWTPPTTPAESRAEPAADQPHMEIQGL